MPIYTYVIPIIVILVGMYVLMKYFPDIFDSAVGTVGGVLGFSGKVVEKGIAVTSSLARENLVADYNTAKELEQTEKINVEELKKFLVNDKNWSDLMRYDLEEYKKMHELLGKVIVIKMFKKEDCAVFRKYLEKTILDLNKILKDNDVEKEAIKKDIKNFDNDLGNISKRASKETSELLRRDLVILMGLEKKKLDTWKYSLGELEDYEGHMQLILQDYIKIFKILKKAEPNVPSLKEVQEILKIHDSFKHAFVKSYDLIERKVMLDQDLEKLSLQLQQIALKIESDVRLSA